MPGKSIEQSFPDSFFQESLSSPPSKHQPAQRGFVKDLISSIDELPDFHDPYSDLSLFLSHKIKQEINHYGNAKKWSVKIQEDLLEKITPDFQKKFPHCRLGIAAVRKTWEKITHFLQQIQGEKEAVNGDGKINVTFFIKENLKQYALFKNPYQLQPYHYAHQLAMKISECMATIDGVRPKIDHLTKLIWAMQRHLLPGKTLKQIKSPYDECDKIDKLIVKMVLEITAKEPLLSQVELEYKVRENLHALPQFASLDQLTSNVSALLAEKLYASLTLLAEEKEAALTFIRKHVNVCLTSCHPPHLADLARRISALYTLGSQLPKHLSDDEIKAAFAEEKRSTIPQSIYAFISAENALQQTAPDETTILNAYAAAKKLPEFKGKEQTLLDVLIWKVLGETEGLLEMLPYRIGQRIAEEIGGILIDHPHQSFSTIVHLTTQFFERMKELAIPKLAADIDRKIHSWTLQGDMLCSVIRIDSDTPLLQLIIQKQQKNIPHQAFVSEVCIEYLKHHPELVPYSSQLASRIWTLYKYAWYTSFAKEDDTSFDRFIQWHIVALPGSSAERLEKICQKTLPMMPSPSS